MQIKMKHTKFLIFAGLMVLVVGAFFAFKPTAVNAVAPTATATPTKAAAQPTATPVPFTATVDVVAMYPSMGEINPANGRPKGVTAQTADGKGTYAVFGPGTRNVPPGVPVYVQAGSISLAQGAKLKDYAWELKAPGGSTAKLDKVAKPVPGLTDAMASFTPDKEGEYTVNLVVTDDKGAKSKTGSVVIVATKYVGNAACAGCHKEQAEGWAETKHGTAFQRFVDENAEGEYFSAGYGCARCHTVGYYPVAQSTGGWWDVFNNVLKMDWNKTPVEVKAKDKDGKETSTKYASLSQAIALNAFGAGSTFASLDTKLQAVSNIGCESCHGPGGAHVASAPDQKKATAPMTTGDSSSCLQCHAASGHHTRGNAMLNSVHSENASLAEGDRTPCNACHSPEGAIDIASGVDPAKARAENGDIGCPVCHDPHSDKNSFQLRQVGTVKVTTGSVLTDVKNVGLSASCVTCHNNRTNPNDPKTGVATDKTSYPHYSSAAELLQGVGGYDWGATLKNSYHVNLGQGVINDEHSNQPGNMDFTQINNGQAPGSCVLCHMYVTPGGVWDTYTKDAKTGKETGSLVTPGHNTVGGHTFNMVAETKDGKTVEHVDACQQCHPGVTDFNFKASADYDGNGKADGVQTEVKGLLDLTWKAIVAKAQAEKITLTKVDGYPYYTVAPKDAKMSTDLKAAIYNYRYVNGIMWGGNGKASSIHNFQRSVALLQLTIAKLSGKDLPNATILYEKSK